MDKARWLTVLTMINLVLLVWLVFKSVSMPTAMAANGAWSPVASPLPMLRGSGLEIVDAKGEVRAAILIQPPVTVDGKDYPETAMLRLIDDQRKPLVKLVAASNGSALSLSDPGDHGVMIHARESGSFVRVQGADSREAILKP